MWFVWFIIWFFVALFILRMIVIVVSNGWAKFWGAAFYLFDINKRAKGVIVGAIIIALILATLCSFAGDVMKKSSEFTQKYPETTSEASDLSNSINTATTSKSDFKQLELNEDEIESRFTVNGNYKDLYFKTEPDWAYMGEIFDGRGIVYYVDNAAIYIYYDEKDYDKKTFDEDIAYTVEGFESASGTTVPIENGYNPQMYILSENETAILYVYYKNKAFIIEMHGVENDLTAENIETFKLFAGTLGFSYPSHYEY